MNTEAIEIQALSKLKSKIALLGYTIPEIPDNDKSPSWDGFIKLYEQKDYTGKHGLIRIPVQVKGHYQKAPYEDIISFSIERDDLVNYLNECGCIFFVIYVDENDNFQIYYNSLTQLKIKRLLKGKENQKTISVNMEIFPNNKEAAVDVFFKFSLDKQMVLPVDDISIKDVFEGNLDTALFNGFNLSFKTIQYIDNPWEGLINIKPTLALKDALTGRLVPIETDYKLAIISKEAEPIYVNGTKYFDSFERYNQENNNVTLKISKSFSIDLHFEKEFIHAKFNFQIRGNLSERIHDTKFIIDVLTNKVLTISNHNLTFPINDSEKTYNDLEYYKRNLTLLEKIKELLNVLHVSTELEYDKVSPEDEQVLICLINCILLKTKYYHSEKECYYIYRLTIANLQIILVAEKIDKKSSYLFDFFDERNKAECCFSFAGEDKKFNIPNSFILRESDFINLDNINYEKIFNDITQFKTNENNQDYLQYYIQEMITGYNKRTKDKSKLLECINKLKNLGYVTNV